MPAVKSILTALDSGSVQNLINFAPGGANTLLFKACENGHRDVVNFLLDKGKYHGSIKITNQRNYEPNTNQIRTRLIDKIRTKKIEFRLAMIKYEPRNGNVILATKYFAKIIAKI